MTRINKHRRSIRLPDYDYTMPGAYLVTICTANGKCIFGEINNGKMRLNEFGRIAQEEWERSSVIRNEIEMDSFVVMPNHIHGIVFILDINTNSNVGATGRSPLRSPKSKHKYGIAPRSLGAFVAGFKSILTKRINIIRCTPGTSVWQRGYYEHVVRSDLDLKNIREYIVNNPARWDFDKENPIQ